MYLDLELGIHYTQSKYAEIQIILACTPPVNTIYIYNVG